MRNQGMETGQWKDRFLEISIFETFFLKSGLFKPVTGEFSQSPGAYSSLAPPKKPC